MNMTRREFIKATIAASVVISIPGALFRRRKVFRAAIEIPAGGVVDLRALAAAAGYAGEENASVKFTLSETVAGLDVGSWPKSCRLAINIEPTGRITCFERSDLAAAHS